MKNKALFTKLRIQSIKVNNQKIFIKESIIVKKILAKIYYHYHKYRKKNPLKNNIIN